MVETLLVEVVAMAAVIACLTLELACRNRAGVSHIYIFVRLPADYLLTLNYYRPWHHAQVREVFLQGR